LIEREKQGRRVFNFSGDLTVPMPMVKSSSQLPSVLFFLPFSFDLFPYAFNASKTYPPFPGKYPAFIFNPFRGGFLAVAIFTDLLAINRPVDLALHRILIIFLYDKNGDFFVVVFRAHFHPLPLVALGGYYNTGLGNKIRKRTKTTGKLLNTGMRKSGRCSQ
jgi:hypothetical protein